MDPETLFSAAGAAAMSGWLALLAGPFAPRLSHIVAGRVIPLVLSVGYTALVLAPVAFAWRLRRAEPHLAGWSLALGGIAGLLFGAYAIGVVGAVPGLQQRTFNTLVDAWYVLIAVWLLRRDPAGRRAAPSSAADTRA